MVRVRKSEYTKSRRSTKPGVRSSRTKSKSDISTVEDYIKAVPEAARENFQTLRAAVGTSVPKQSQEVISYRIPAIRHDDIVVWYAAFARHCSLFPTAEVIKSFEKELAGYSTSKGTIQFPNDKPLPLALIKKIVKARVAIMEGKRRQ